MDFLSIKDLKNEEKIILLKELGYNSDGIFVTNEIGAKVYDRYIDDLPVRIDNMLILSGSTVILDDNPLSIASYLEEFPDAF